MVTETFDEYIKRYHDLINELGIKPEKYFLQEYLDFVSNRIRAGEKITKSVYENIPDLHYWIDHCYTIHRISVIA